MVNHHCYNFESVIEGVRKPLGSGFCDRLVYSLSLCQLPVSRNEHDPRLRNNLSYGYIDRRTHDHGRSSDRECRWRGMENDELEHYGEDNLL